MSEDSLTKPKTSAKKPTGLSLGRLLASTLWPLVAFYATSLALVAIFNALGSTLNFELKAVYQNSDLFRFVFNITTNTAILAMAIWPFFNYVFKAGTNWRQVFGLGRMPKFSDAGWATLALSGYFVTAYLIILITALVWPNFDVDQAQELGIGKSEALWQYILVFVSLVIIPPLIEEVIFRGYMFGALRRQLGFWVSAILTSVAFGLVHGQLNVALDTFALSMYSCYLREKTGSLWASILIHMFKNLIAFTALIQLGRL